MGRGITQAIVCAGFQVILLDVNHGALDTATTAIASCLARLVAKQKLADDDRHAALGRIATSTDYGSLATADLVIEAATENVDLKLRILCEIDREVGGEVVIATNTSSISITRLAAAVSEPARVIGMHFFNPVPLMPLVEGVRGLQTSEQTVEAVRAIAIAADKSPIVVASSPGFVINRLPVPMINEAFFLLEQGVAQAEEIDAGMKLGANHPMGPLALADLIGLDVCLSIMEVLHTDLGDPKYRANCLLREMVSAGSLGRKTSRGVYQYDS